MTDRPRPDARHRTAQRSPPSPAPPDVAPAAGAPRPAPACARLVARPEHRPAWVRPALCWPCSSATAVLYLWGLGASGWANSYYSAAVQAGTKSWKAFFFGSSDAANSSPSTSRRRRCGSWRSRPASSA